MVYTLKDIYPVRTLLKYFLLVLQALPAMAQMTDEEIMAEAARQRSQGKDEVLAEGRRLYRVEQATWYAADIFSEKLPEKTDAIGGYFSYADADTIKTIYFSNTANPNVIATIYFDTTLNIRNAKFDSRERTFTRMEQQLYYLRFATITDITAGTGFYKRYNNTDLNIIPLIDSGYKRVYVMTGLKQSCLVIFGNDYLLTFDENNAILSRKHLHRNIIPVECSHDMMAGEHPSGGSHTHNFETGELPTATDICTLMLYSKQANWKQHTIYSPDNVGVWNCDTNDITMLTKDEWKSRNAPPPPPKKSPVKKKKTNKSHS